MSSLFLLSLHLLYHCFPLLSRASASGTLALFLDMECEEPSIINPTVNVATDVCLIANNALGLAVEVLPPCASGEATLQLYQDTSCANQMGTDYNYENCYFGVSAVLFACTAVAGESHATATTTVSAGSSSIAIATGAPASPTDTSPPNTPSTNEAAATSSTNPNPTSTNPTKASTTGAAGSASSSGSGLSQNAQIGLGVGLPVGSIVVALLAWLCPCTKRIVRHRRPGANEGRRNLIGSLGHQANQGYQMWNSPQGFATSPANSNTQLGFGGNPIGNSQGALPSW